MAHFIGLLAEKVRDTHREGQACGHSETNGRFRLREM